MNVPSLPSSCVTTTRWAPESSASLDDEMFARTYWLPSPEVTTRMPRSVSWACSSAPLLLATVARVSVVADTDTSAPAKSVTAERSTPTPAPPPVCVSLEDWTLIDSIAVRPLTV